MNVGRFFQEYVDDNSYETFLYGVLTVLVLIFLARIVYRIAFYARARRRPLLLFYELSALHGVLGGAQKRLVALAREHNVTDPAYLFICPELVRQIESLEMSQAANEKEKRRLAAFFGEFRRAAYGQS